MSRRFSIACSLGDAGRRRSPFPRHLHPVRLSAHFARRRATVLEIGGFTSRTFCGSTMRLRRDAAGTPAHARDSPALLRLGQSIPQLAGLALRRWIAAPAPDPLVTASASSSGRGNHRAQGTVEEVRRMAGGGDDHLTPVFQLTGGSGLLWPGASDKGLPSTLAPLMSAIVDDLAPPPAVRDHSGFDSGTAAAQAVIPIFPSEWAPLQHQTLPGAAEIFRLRVTSRQSRRPAVVGRAGSSSRSAESPPFAQSLSNGTLGMGYGMLLAHVGGESGRTF